MFSRIRKRITYANVVMTLALVFAMTGGAFAAGKYLIVSTKQIKPSVLAQLKGKNGKNGTNGTNGVNGTQGAKGETGSQGPKGETGKDGVSVTSRELTSKDAACNKEGGSEFTAATGNSLACNGKEGKEGLEGPAGLPCAASGTLPSGKTESGLWIINTFAVEGKTGFGEISFPCPLAATTGATVHFIKVEEGEGEPNEAAAIKNHECGGTYKEPKAAGGNLCVFEWFSKEATVSGSVSVTGKFGEAGPNGVLLEFNPGPFPEIKGTGEHLGEALATGSWAVTAK